MGLDFSKIYKRRSIGKRTVIHLQTRKEAAAQLSTENIKFLQLYGYKVISSEWSG